MIIGVTGLIGSGKSTVTKTFASLGAAVIDADVIGKQVVENDPVVLYQLVLAFGDIILNPDGKLNRRQLGLLAFSSVAKTTLLNSIVHPALLRKLDKDILAARRKTCHTVVDAALLINWRYQERVDVTILVSATVKNRLDRLASIGLSRAEFLQRSKSQLPLNQLRKMSDIVVSNNHSIDILRKKSAKLYHELTEKG